jgi:hypothetical protein
LFCCCAAGNNDLRIGFQYGFAVYRRGQGSQSGENISAATQFDDLTDQVFTVDRHQRLMPDLVKSSYRCQLRELPTDLHVFIAECLGRRYSGLTGSGQLAQSLQITGDILESAWLAVKHWYAEIYQAFDLSTGIATLPGYHQVRVKGDDLFQIEASRASHFRELLCRWRVVTVTGHTDDPLAGAGSKQQLGGVWREADNASGRLVQDQAAAAVVSDFQRRGVAGVTAQECQQQ